MFVSNLTGRRILRASGCLLVLCGAAAWAQDKPEVKSLDVLCVPAGKTLKVTVYGERLAPKEATVARPKLAVKLLEAKDTEGDAKGKGGRQVTLEVSADPDCPPETFEIVLVQPDGGKASVKVPVAPGAEQEVEVKRPCDSPAKAMPVGPSTAVTGVANGDTPDVFRIEAKRGEAWEATLLTGRGGSEMNPVLRLRDARGNSLALSVGSKRRDRRIAFTARADGPYYLYVSEIEGQVGGNRRYRLTVLKKPGK